GEDRVELAVHHVGDVDDERRFDRRLEVGEREDHLGRAVRLALDGRAAEARDEAGVVAELAGRAMVRVAGGRAVQDDGAGAQAAYEAGDDGARGGRVFERGVRQTGVEPAGEAEDGGRFAGPGRA